MIGAQCRVDARVLLEPSLYNLIERGMESYHTEGRDDAGIRRKLDGMPNG